MPRGQNYQNRSGAWPKANKSRIAKFVQAWPKLKHAWPKYKNEWPKLLGDQDSDVAKMHDAFGHTWP